MLTLRKKFTCRYRVFWINVPAGLVCSLLATALYWKRRRCAKISAFDTENGAFSWRKKFWNDGKHLINRWVNVGEHAVSRHFLVVRCPRKREKTHAEWRKMSVNSLFCHLKTPENAMLSHWKTAVNNGIRSVPHVLTVCFPCVLLVLSVR